MTDISELFAVLTCPFTHRGLTHRMLLGNCSFCDLFKESGCQNRGILFTRHQFRCAQTCKMGYPSCLLDTIREKRPKNNMSYWFLWFALFPMYSHFLRMSSSFGSQSTISSFLHGFLSHERQTEELFLNIFLSFVTIQEQLPSWNHYQVCWWDLVVIIHAWFRKHPHTRTHTCRCGSVGCMKQN